MDFVKLGAVCKRVLTLKKKQLQSFLGALLNSVI